jgi:hypothetical protein
VVLPEGIDPGDVTLKEAPKGWDLTPTRVGYILGGPEIPAGTDAEYKITVRRLPDATSLAFKTVETYGDGTIARWIELPTGGEEPEQPAPVLELQAAAPGAKPADTSSSASAEAASSPSAASESPAPAPSDTAPSEASEDGGVPATLPIAGAVAAVLAVGGGIWWFKRRSAADGR